MLSAMSDWRPKVVPDTCLSIEMLLVDTTLANTMFAKYVNPRTIAIDSS